MISKFHRGSSVFPCRVCGRKTRDTGAQSAGNKICPECFDLAGIENEISDGYRTLNDAFEAIEINLSKIEAKGGNITEWRETFKRRSDQE